MGGLIEDAKALADETPSGWLDPNLEPTPTVAAARKAYEERYGVPAVVEKPVALTDTGAALVPNWGEMWVTEARKAAEMPALGINEKGRLYVIDSAPALPHLIGVCGRFRAGKDTIGEHLIASYGYKRYAFADKLKDLARLIGWNGEKDETGRKLLQELGIGAREILGDDVWIRAVDREIYGGEAGPGWVVVTDVRLPNEAEWIRSNGGQVWKVIRKGAALSTPASNHVSETSVDEIRPDVIVPNVGSIEDLHWVVDEILKGGK
jgi:hypothetical protein